MKLPHIYVKQNNSQNKQYYDILSLPQYTSPAIELKQELIRRWDSERELLRSTSGRYPNSLK